MIVDQALFESLSRMSNKRVLCRCDTCFKEELALKSEISKRGGIHQDCKSCATKKRLKGIPRKTFRTHFKYTKDENFFSSPNLLNSYWAGFIAADGHLASVRRSVSLQILLQRRDRGHLERFNLDSKFTGPIIDSHGYGYPNSCLRIHASQTWALDLEQHWNIPVGSKTLSLNPPRELSHVNSLAYIVGFIDGDGTIYRSIRDNDLLHLRIYGLQSILHWIRTQLDLLDETTDLTTLTDTSTSYLKGMTISGQRAHRILSKLQILEVPKLERKWSRIKNLHYTRRPYNRHDPKSPKIVGPIRKGPEEYQS